MEIRINIFVTWILLGWVLSLPAQDSLTTIKVIGKVSDSGIVLRWAPTTPVGWYLSLTSGYRLERMEMADSSAGLDQVQFEIINPQIKPWVLDQWQTIAPPVMNDPYAAVAAQMIYGQNWNSKNEPSSITDKIDELQNRYAYTTMASDFSANAADAAGLRFVDINVKPKHTYIYRVYSLINREKYQVDTGYTVVHTAQPAIIPQPGIHEIVSGDHVVHLRWDRRQYQGDFTGYFIERSDDEINFSRLHEAPYLSSVNEYDSLSNYYFTYSDSVLQNYQNYYYRIVGITPFAEYSIPSQVMVAQALDLTPPGQPLNVHATQLGPNTIRLDWDYDESQNPDLKGFLIGHSIEVLEDFHPLNFVPISDHFFIHDSADVLLPNFYIVAAVDTAGNNSLSLSTYGHLIDSIPPGPPTGFTGIVDSNGLVHLHWTANHEPDLLGYTVHYSNDSSHVFACITDSTIWTNDYVDTVMILSLTEEVYYKVVAVDKNYNYSSFSSVLSLIKPDLVPPSAPVFIDFVTDTTSIALHWNNSTSHDVSSHQLWRHQGEEGWTMIYSTSDLTQHAFLDRNVEPGAKVEYKILSVDDAGNQSESAFTYTLQTKQMAPDAIDLNLEILDQEGRFELSWQKYQSAGTYLIYRSENSGPFAQVKRTSQNRWTDTKIRSGQKYAYRIRIIVDGGQYTDFSQPVYQP